MFCFYINSTDSLEAIGLSSRAFRLHLSAFVARHTRILSLSSVLGTTSSMERGCLLKGSCLSESKWDLMVAKSTVICDAGRITGSSMSVNSRGSAPRKIKNCAMRISEKMSPKNSSGTSPSSSSCDSSDLILFSTLSTKTWISSISACSF